MNRWLRGRVVLLVWVCVYGEEGGGEEEGEGIEEEDCRNPSPRSFDEDLIQSITLFVITSNK